MKTHSFILQNRLSLMLVFLILLFTHQAWSQEQVSKVVSNGGGISTGGNYSNFSIVGGEPASANISGSRYSVKAGFIFGSSSALVGLPFYLSMSVVPAEAGLAAGAGYYHKGENVPVTAIANSGWTFVGWSAPTGGISAVNSSNTTFTMPGQNVVLTAHFVEQTTNPVTYTIALSTNSEGVGTVTGAGEYLTGTNINLTATPNEGYQFLSWKEGTTIVSTSQNFSFEVNGDRNLVAHFAVNRYTLTLKALPDGNIGGGALGSGTFAHGTEVTVKAVANLGFTFEGWSEFNSPVSSDNNYTFTITSNRDLVANFDGQKYTVSSQALAAETGATAGDGEYYQGDIVTMNAIPDSGYYFLRWMEGAQQVSVKNPYLFSASADRNLTAEFAEKWGNNKGPSSKSISYLITAEVSPVEVGVVLGQGNYTEGEEVTLVASPNKDISFVKWTENGVDVSTEVTYVFTASANRNLVAVFDGMVYKVAVESSPLVGGESTVSNNGSFYTGDFASVNAEPNNGYGFVNWTLGAGGPQLSVLKNYGFTVEADSNLVANFEEQEQYVLSLTVYPVGAGITTGAGNYTKGASAAIAAQPNEGYEFVYWSRGAELISSNSNASVDVISDMELEAYFALKSYLLTYMAGAGGTLSGDTSQTVLHGSNGSSITAIPNLGYKFVDWSDGSTDNPRTDLNLNGGLSVTANFAQRSYLLTYLAGEGGTVAGELTQNLTYGLNGTPVTALPNTGYSFVKWSDDVTANPRTDLNVTEDINVTAQFMINTYTLAYSAGEGGSISGAATQSVTHGSNGSSVEALAEACYQFMEWSDGVTNNPRTDVNVSGNLSVKAIFAEREIDATVTVLENTLTANNSNATYQWLVCGATNENIEGATGRSFTPTQSGTYAVIVTDNDCSVLSECATITITGTGSPLAEELNFSVYPNPSSGDFTISSGFEGDFTLFNSLGQVVQRMQLNQKNGFQFKVEELGMGEYLLIGQNGNRKLVQKIVVTE